MVTGAGLIAPKQLAAMLGVADDDVRCIRAGLDLAGNVTAWESELFIPNGTASFVALVGADLAGLNSLGRLSPGGVLNDLAIPYSFPNVSECVVA
jgi:hypothetical protein